MAAEIKITKRVQQIISAAEKLGITDFYAVRNLRIKHDFRTLKADGKSYSDTIAQLSRDYKISPETVQNVLSDSYSKRKKSKQWQ